MNRDGDKAERGAGTSRRQASVSQRATLHIQMITDEAALALLRAQPNCQVETTHRFSSGWLAFSTLAASIAWFGISINAWYGETLGKSPETSSLLARPSVSADIPTLTLAATGPPFRPKGIGPLRCCLVDVDADHCDRALIDRAMAGLGN